MYMSSRFQEGLEHHEARIWCSRHNSCHHFSVNHLVQTSVHYTSSLFINYTYMLYTCHCILHHNTSILKQFKVLLWMLRLCITVPYMYHYTSLCKQVTQASLSTSRAVIYHPNCSYSAAASTIGILTSLTAVQKSMIEQYACLSSYVPLLKRTRVYKCH